MAGNSQQDDKPKSKKDPSMAYRRMSEGRRGGVSAESYTVEQLCRGEKKVIPKDAKTKRELYAALKGHVLFKHLDPIEQQDIFDCMFEMVYLPGDLIVNQGDDGDNFYIISEGEVDVYIDKNFKHTLGEGSYFGELALIYNTPRSADVKAKTDVKLWAIDRDSYRRILAGNTLKKRQMYGEFLASVPLLSSLDDWELTNVADALEEVNFEPNEVIIQQGDDGDHFFIIVEGWAHVLIKTNPDPTVPQLRVASLGPSSYFGELALLFNKPRAATIIAETKMKCVRLDRGRFERLLGNCADVLMKNLENYNTPK